MIANKEIFISLFHFKFSRSSI